MSTKEKKQSIKIYALSVITLSVFMATVIPDSNFVVFDKCFFTTSQDVKYLTKLFRDIRVHVCCCARPLSCLAESVARWSRARVRYQYQAEENPYGISCEITFIISQQSLYIYILNNAAFNYYCQNHSINSSTLTANYLFVLFGGRVGPNCACGHSREVNMHGFQQIPLECEGDWDPALDTTVPLMFQAISALLQHTLFMEATQVCGYRVIFDLRTLSWRQLRECTPANLLLLISATQYCFPARYKGFHLITESKLFNTLWTLVKPLLTSKLKRRIQIHSDDLEPLKKHIHPNVLPRELGGDAGPIDASIWKTYLDEHTDRLMSLLKYGYKN